ncbi:MAG: glycosyltransferase, partial [Rariglobus sp.]
MPRIPRHFHFIFGLREQTEPFHLVHYLCLESCLRVNRPDRVTLYYHYEPYGRYWNLIKDRIQLVHVPLHPLVTSQHYDDPLISRKLRYAHHADFIRLEKLIEHGGVYADMDTLFLRPIPDGLYEKAFVIGREDPVTDMKTGAISDSLCNALMMAEPGSAFARIWLERMPAALDGSWSNHS